MVPIGNTYMFIMSIYWYLMEPNKKCDRIDAGRKIAENPNVQILRLNEHHYTVKSQTTNRKYDKKIDKLEKEFDKYVKELNKHGIATQEQWDANPQYWRSMNLPDLPASETNDSSHSQTNLELGNTIETMSHGCGSCTQPQQLHVIAGFDYLLWGFWPTSAYSVHGWKTLTYNGDSDVTNVTVEEDHDSVLPHITQKIAKTGIVNYDYGYDARIYGTYIDSNNGNLNAIQVDPSSLAITQDELTDVQENTTIGFDVEVIWGIN